MLLQRLLQPLADQPLLVRDLVLAHRVGLGVQALVEALRHAVDGHDQVAIPDEGLELRQAERLEL